MERRNVRFYSQTFCKLLQLDEGLCRPSAYQLLHTDPAEASAQWMLAAARYWRLHVILKVPGAMHVPMAELVDRELQWAAATLMDPVSRKGYDAELTAAAEETPANQKRAEQIAMGCRKAVAWLANAGGAVEDTRRSELTNRLHLLGLSDEQIKHVQERTPTALRPAAGVHPQIAAYFIAAIDLVVAGGILDPASEQKLLALADRLAIPRKMATEALASRLAARSASRAVPDAAKASFVKHLERTYPGGVATAAQRQAALAKGIEQGVQAEMAYELIRERLQEAAPSPTPPESPAAGQTPPMLQPVGQEPPAAQGPPPLPPLELAGEPIDLEADEPLRAEAIEALSRGAFSPAASPREVEPPAATGRSGIPRIAAVAAAAIVLAAAGLLIYSQCSFKERHEVAEQPMPGNEAVAPPADKQAPPVPTPPRKTQTTPKPIAPAGVPPKPPEASPPQSALLANMLEAKTREALLAVLAAADTNEMENAFDAAAAGLSGGALQQQEEVESLLNSLMRCPPPSPAVQKAMVQSLIDYMEVPRNGGRHARHSKVLAKALFLRDYLSVPGTGSPAEHCRGAWNESLQKFPADPLHDPLRIALAVADGGDFVAYASRSDANHVAAVWSRLADLTVGGTGRASEGYRRVEALARGYNSAPQDMAREAKLMLCAVLQRSTSVTQANRVRSDLASILDVPYNAPVRRMALTDAAARQQAAAEMRDLVDLGAIGTPFAISAMAIRGAYSSDGGREALLADLALTMMACRERASRLSGNGGGELPSELAKALQETGVVRAALLAKGLTFDIGRASRDANAGGGSKEITDYARLFSSGTKAQKYAAIEELLAMDTPEAAGLLLQQVEIAAKSSSAESTALAVRALKALSAMHEAGIPKRLVEALRIARSESFAAQIETALAAGYGTYSSRYSRHASEDRAAAVKRWENEGNSRYRTWAGSRRSGVVRTVRKERGVAASAEPIEAPQILLLCASVARQAEATNSQVQAFWRGPLAADREPTSRPSLCAGDAMVEALVVGAADLEKAARSHPKAAKLAGEMDKIAKATTVRWLACESSLQEAAVGLDAQGAWLDVLVRMGDASGRHSDARRAIDKRRTASLAKVTSVLEELRETAYHNLLLWDLLLRARKEEK